MAPREYHIALVLGSGGARGLAHIGVLKCLEECHIHVDCIVGTSIGALIGGIYASGISIGAMEDVLRTMDKLAVARILMPGFSASGIVPHARVRQFIKRFVGDKRIEHLAIDFSAVSTDMVTGEEVVFDKGPLVDAILASITIPVVFRPFYHGGRYLVDGGLSNPLPVSVAYRKMPHHCIAVDVSPNPERIRKILQKKTNRKDSRKNNALPLWLLNAVKARGYSIETLKIPALPRRKQREIYFPTAVRVSLQSISISEHNLILQHLKQAPPDVLISPKIEEYDMLDFFKGGNIIQCGYDAAKLVVREIQALL